MRKIEGKFQMPGKHQLPPVAGKVCRDHQIPCPKTDPRSELVLMTCGRSVTGIHTEVEQVNLFTM